MLNQLSKYRLTFITSNGKLYNLNILLKVANYIFITKVWIYILLKYLKYDAYILLKI